MRRWENIGSKVGFLWELSKAACMKSEQSCVDENEQSRMRESVQGRVRENAQSHMRESVQGRVRENAQKRHRHKSETVVRVKVGCGNRMFMVKYR